MVGLIRVFVSWYIMKTLHIITLQTAGEVIQFGILQCRDLCLNRYGCVSANFSLSALSCQTMYSDKTENPTTIIIRITDSHSIKTMRKVSDMAKVGSSCSKKFKLFLNRDNNVLCRTQEKRIGVGNRKGVGFRRILVFTPPKVLISKIQSVKQMFVLNLTVRAYKYIDVKHPVAAAYSVTDKTLIIATTSTDPSVDLGETNCTIQFFHIDSSHCFQTEKVCVVRNMDVDDSKGLVFLPTVFPSKGIMVMPTRGKDLRIVVKTKHRPECIAVDSTSSLVFLSFPTFEISKIVRYMYNGSVVDVIITTKKQIQKWMTFDSNTNTLYFQVNTKIHLYFPSNNSISSFKKIRKVIQSFHIIDGDMFYILNTFQNKIMVLRKDGRKTRSFIKNPSYYGKTTCLVM